MHFYEIRHSIAAPAERVWANLVDARKIVEGGLGLLKIEGRIGPGETIKLWSEAAPKRAFRLRVTAWEPARRMIWEGGMPLGLFRGVRGFELTPSEGGVSFHMREDFSGPLVKLIWKSMPDLNPSFAKFARGLQALSEGRPA